MVSIGDKIQYYRRHSRDKPIVIEEGIVEKIFIDKYQIRNPVGDNPLYIYRLKDNVWNPRQEDYQ